MYKVGYGETFTVTGTLALLSLAPVVVPDVVDFLVLDQAFRDFFVIMKLEDLGLFQDMARYGAGDDFCDGC